jgi:hypothetical protein
MRIHPVPETERRVAAPDERAHLGAERRAEAQVDPGMRVAKAPQGGRERGAGEGADQGEGHRAAVGRLERGHGVAGVAHRGEQRLGGREKRAARVRQDAAAGAPLEERCADRLLEEARRLTAGWDRCSAAAARVKPPFRTMVTNAST